MAIGAFDSDAFSADAFFEDAFLFTDTGVIVPDVVGQSQASGTTELEVEGFVVSVQTAYSSSVAVGLIISQSPIAGVEAASGSTVTITVSLGDAPVADESFSGGFIVDYEREQIRRARERRRRRELEEESERIEEQTTREIARLLREQEAKSARRDELARLSALVAHHKDRSTAAELGERVDRAVRKAAAKQTAWALFQLEREMYRAQEEEAFILEALRIALDHE